MENEELKKKKSAELNKIAKDMNITGYGGLKKSELINEKDVETKQRGSVFPL